MRLRLVAALAAVVPLLLVQAPVQADPPDRADTAPGRERAERVLQEVKKVLGEGAADQLEPRSGAGEQAESRSATLLLRDLLAARPQLSASDRRVVDAVLARPTDRSGGAFGERYSVPEATPVCGPNVCVHYVRSTSDAPPLADNNGDGIPDSVARTLDIAEKVHTRYVAAGYRRPIGDGSRGGGTNKVDVYLSDIGSQGLYGYCTSDQPTSSGEPDYTLWAYCSLDDDFSSRQFPNGKTPLQNLQVTMAHEYFHAVQFAYDAMEDGWLMEATAAWVEDEVYDNVNDNLQYLPAGQMGRPGRPLDKFSSTEGTHYGNWIFFRYLTERFPAAVGGLPVAVRNIWEKVGAETGDPDMYSLQGVVAQLKELGTTLPAFYSDFANANRRPRLHYEEGASYDYARPAAIHRLSSDARGTGWRSTTQKHLTSTAVRFTPAAGTSQSNWRLRLSLDLFPRRAGSAARITTYKQDGTVSSQRVPLDSEGKATVAVDFSSSRVQYVEAVYVNASQRTTCWASQVQDPHYSCYGIPKMDSATQRYRGYAFRS